MPNKQANNELDEKVFLSDVFKGFLFSSADDDVI